MPSGHFLKDVNICAFLPALPATSPLPSRDAMAQKGRKKAKKKAKTPAASLKHDNIPRVFLARELQRQIDRFGLSREVAGTVVRDAPSQVSRLMTGHANEFSADRLVAWLRRLGSDVTITIRHARRLGRRGKVRISAS